MTIHTIKEHNKITDLITNIFSGKTQLSAFTDLKYDMSVNILSNFLKW